LTWNWYESVKWARKAADQGNADAEGGLGELYGAGRGVLQDHAEAAKWLRKAADQGNANAQYDLGIAYFKGLGVPQDYAIAYMWLNLGAAGGNKDAAKFRDALTANMTPAQIAAAQRLAREWKPGQK
jgi:uncharacterized protein